MCLTKLLKRLKVNWHWLVIVLLVPVGFAWYCLPVGAAWKQELEFYQTIRFSPTNATITLTVTALGGLLSPPTDFQATFINDYEVSLTWTKGASANNTIIRAKYNDYPSSPTDGYGVYWGVGSSANDTATNFYEYLGTIYYAAWSDNNTGTDNVTWSWSSESALADLGGPAVSDLVDLLKFIVIVLLIAGGFIALAKWTKSTFIQIMAGLVTITAGIAYIAMDPDIWTNLIFGTAIIAVGLYFLIMVGVDLLRGE